MTLPEVGLSIFGLLPLALFGIMAAALIDIARRTTATWEASGYSQFAWIAVVLLVPIIGGLIYLAEIRPVLAEMPHLRLDRTT